MLKSIVAVVVGFLLVTILCGSGDLVLIKAMPQAVHGGHIDDPMALAITLLYSLVFATLGGFVTARLAPHHPLRHAIILGCFGLAASILAAVALWNTGPVWYHIGALVIPLPAAWIGGSLREAQLRKSNVAAA